MSSRVPKLRHHKGRNLFCVALNGRTHYLGRDREEAKRRYDAMIQEWLANDRLPPAPPAPQMSVTELCVRYFKMAKNYYSDAEVLAVRASLRTVRRLYGPGPVTAFGPLALKATRQVWIDDGNCRTYVNRKVGIIKRMFKWAVSEELVPATILHALQSVTGLRRGRSDAHDLPPVEPVDSKTVDVTIPYLPIAVAGMVRVQCLCGMRPGEVVRMTMGEINRDEKVWTYTPRVHKTMHHGHTRTVFIGPRAQKILRDFFRADPNAALFDPRDDAKARRNAGDCYTVVSYRRIVVRACKAAKVDPWVPLQLRHSRATDVRRDFGLEAAQVVLGHSKADVSQVYAERNFALAIKVAEETG